MIDDYLVLLHASILSKSSFAVHIPQQPVTKVIYIFIYTKPCHLVTKATFLILTLFNLMYI